MQTLIILIILFINIYVISSHPQCLDYLPPFSPSHTSFCAGEYSEYSCCTQEQEHDLAIEFWDRMQQQTRLKRGICGRYIQNALCTLCSPFSAHIYDAESATPAQHTPGLCPHFCVILYRFNCTDILLDLFGVPKREFKSAQDFCNEFNIADTDYCYPDVLQQATNLTSGIKTPEDGSPEREDCLCVKEIASSLRNPIALVAAYDGSHRMFVAEQIGVVYVILENGTLLSEPFLDILSRVATSSYKGDERGLLGIAFHPLFRKNGRVYVYYSTYNTDALRDEYGKFTSVVSRLSQFTLSVNNTNKLDIYSEEIILVVPEPRSNHNGGSLFFDLDNYLYLSLGDGGGAGDKFGSIGNGQNTTNIHGTLIRLDVDDASRRRPDQKYGIPATNPFINSIYEEKRHEIFAYGFRNIWRCALDRGDSEDNSGQGRVLCGDVGQGRYEEVDLVKKGKNYGWRIMEGNTCYTDCDSDTGALEAPIIVYPHSEGKSVIGGKVYRGCLFPRLRGKYIFGDYTSGSIFYGIENETTGHWRKESVCFAADSSCRGGGTSNSYKGGILSFGESESGEIYFLSTSNPSTESAVGSVYQLIDPTARQECSFTPRRPSLATSASRWEHSRLCRGCGPSSITSSNICDVVNEFVLIVSFLSRGRDSFTSEIFWRVEIRDILLLQRQRFRYIRLKDVIKIWESKASAFCRCISSKVIDMDTEKPMSDTLFIVSGRVKGSSLYLYRGDLLLEKTDDRKATLDEYLNSCFSS